jgi:hypothetical protein
MCPPPPPSELTAPPRVCKHFHHVLTPLPLPLQVVVVGGVGGIWFVGGPGGSSGEEAAEQQLRPSQGGLGAVQGPQLLAPCT